jgi:fructuronate reductase
VTPTTISAPPRVLNRAALADADPARRHVPPVRIVHIGLGNFHRAHQAWFTDRAEDAGEWGIAAFTGRSPQAALQLAAQGGLFTLIERAADRDSASIVASIVEAVNGANLQRFVALMSAPSTAIVTLTVTEAGYRLDPSGQPNADDPVLAADLEWSAAPAPAESVVPEAGGPQTTPGRLLLGLEARRRAAGGPIAIVPCDNVPDNGNFLAGGLKTMAGVVNAELARWIDANVSFVSTSVDRITPKTAPADRVTAATLTGWQDEVPVVTEPFADWILSGEFPAGRPAWESAGARFVRDIEPYERRKLWLLNGAHSLLAYSGLRAGYATVAEALSDQQCLRFVNELWDEATRQLPFRELDLAGYRRALLDRFANPRIAYPLRQIATDGVAKLRVRIAPLVLAERAAGCDAAASIRPLATWAALILAGSEFPDSESAAVEAARKRPPELAIQELIALVEPRLRADDGVMRAIGRCAAESGFAAAMP